MSSGETVAGIEFGGTKCVCTLASGPERILGQATVATSGPDETLEAIEQILLSWRGRFAALGIASFGPIGLDRTSPNWGLIGRTPKPGWTGSDIARRLSRAAAAPIVLDTDVNGAALAELRWGAGRGLRDFAYVTVGTGVGAGLIVNGEPVHGFLHPELGHVRVPRLAGDEWPGACPFHGDCVEGLASGPAIAARIGLSDPAAAAPDDPVWETVTHALGQLCHLIVCAAAPQRIAIGGGVVVGRPELLPQIEARLRQSLAGYIELPSAPYVVPPGLGAAAGPMGPIALALAALETAA